MGLAGWGGRFRGIFCPCCGILRIGGPLSPGFGLGLVGGSTITGRGCISVGGTASSNKIDSVAPIVQRVFCVLLEFESRTTKKFRCDDIYEVFLGTVVGKSRLHALRLDGEDIIPREKFDWQKGLFYVELNRMGQTNLQSW